MSSSGGTTVTKATTNPPEFQLPYVKTGLSEAQKLYNQAGPQWFPKSTVVGFNPFEQQGQQAAVTAANGSLTGLAKNSLDAFNFGTSTVLDPNNNQYLGKAVEGALRPIYQNLTEQVLPQLRNGFAMNGGFGGSRQNIAQGLAAARTQQTAADTAAKMYSDAYGQGLQTFSNTMSQMPNVAQAQLAPSEVLSGVGAQQRALDTAKVAEEKAKWDYEQNLPYQKLVEYMNTISRPFGGQSESTTVAPETGGASQWAGAGMAMLPFLRQIFGF